MNPVSPFVIFFQFNTLEEISRYLPKPITNFIFLRSVFHKKLNNKPISTEYIGIRDEALAGNSRTSEEREAKSRHI